MTSYSGTEGQFARWLALSSPNLSARRARRFSACASTRWAGLLFRASAGKAFRAPALDNMYAPSAGTNTGGN